MVSFVYGTESCSRYKSEVTGERKTIVSLDLQLYSKFMLLRSHYENHEEFVFSLGELHTVFALLKMTGKYIEERGLDKILVDSEIYRENTLKQILGGKDMKMSVEAHTTLYLALFRVFINNWYNQRSGSKHKMEKFQKCLPDNLKEHADGLTKIFEGNGILKATEKFESALENQGKFYIDYMKIFEVILLFIPTPRENLLQLHLSSMNDFTKCFFTDNQLNYAHITPLYLASVMDIKERI